MPAWIRIIPIILLTGCFYVSKDKYMSYWDADGDDWPLDLDCNDDNPEIYPYAPDIRGDGCDSDCGEEPDADGDDWPDAVDCDENDPNIYPWSPHEDETDDVDSDCDGSTNIRTDDPIVADPDAPNITSIDCSGGDQ